MSGFLETGRQLLWGALGIAGWALAAVVGLVALMFVCLALVKLGEAIAGEEGEKAVGAVVGLAIFGGVLAGLGYAAWHVWVIAAGALGYEITLDFRDLI